MKNNRRNFIKQLSGLAAAMGIPSAIIAQGDAISRGTIETGKPKTGKAVRRKTHAPLIVTTWNFGLQANEAAWPTLQQGGRALDAIEQGIRHRAMIGILNRQNTLNESWIFIRQ